MEELLSIEISAKIARNLKRIRESKELTQAQVAERANINRVTYSRLETARNIVTLQSLLKLAVALDVTADELLSGVLEAIREKSNA